MDFITAFFGRFHPLLVHLPIGILLLAFLFECLSACQRYRSLKIAVQPALFWGTIFAIASAVSGFFLRQEGGYEEDVANLHQNFGIATAVFSFILLVLRRRVKFWMRDPARKKRLRIIMFSPVILLLIITGHWGGALTHGEDYLFAVVGGDQIRPADPAEKIRAITSVPDAVLYKDVIQPIFEARCYDCHSSRKQKGDLRLDSEELIARGGKNGDLISDGPADSSLLFKRLILPLEHEDHMPPNEKPQLSSAEITLIQYWIEEKGAFDKSVAEFRKHDKIARIIETMKEAPAESWIPTAAVGPADEKALNKLAALGINPMPLASDNHYLMVNFTGLTSVSGEQIRALRDIKEQLVWVNLNNTGITDDQLQDIASLSNLRVLYLNNTAVTDEGVTRLSTLSELRWLSLVGSKVTDRSVPSLVKMKSLTNLFLFGTAVTPDGIQKIFQELRNVKVDTGNYMLRKLPTDTTVYRRTSG